MFAQQISHHPHQGAAAATHLSQSSPSDCFMKTKEGGAKFNPLADKEEQPEESGGQFINRLYENNKKRGCAATKMSTSIDNMALQNSIEEEQKDSVVTTSITKSAAGVGGPEVDGDDVITIVPNEENRAEIRVTLKKPSLTMIQQHSLDSAPLKLQQEIEEKMTTANKLGGTAIRRSSTTPWGNGRKMTLGYKYARRPTEASVSFPIPPVFPKTCSLFDSTFNGGAFADSSEDKKLMDALVKVRRKMSGVQQPGQQTILEGHLMMNNSHTEDLTNMSDSGHSSITEGTSASPPLSGNISFFGHHHSSKDSVFFNNSTDNEHDNKSNEDGSNAQRRLKKRKSDFGLRKNSRIFFFRQRAKTNSEKRKNSAKSAPAINGQDANENGNNELPARPWTIDGSKGLSWKRKLLRTLSSAGGIHLGANHQEKGKEIGLYL